MNRVFHLMRKFLPGTASFIYNQIIHHEQYQPGIVYCERDTSVFRKKLMARYLTFRVVEGWVGHHAYRFLRMLTASEEKELLHFLRKQQTDLLHIHYGVDALVYADLIRKAGLPVLVSFYGYDCTSFPNRFGGMGKKWLQQRLFKNPAVTAYTAMSPDMKEDLLRLGCPEKKIIVHYHGSDPGPFYRKREYPDKQDIRFLIISSLTPKKGHLFLLKAFKKAQQRTDKQLHLKIVGKGESEKQIQAHIASNDLSHVKLHGPIDYGSEEHHRLLDEADVFVHPSVTTSRGEKEGIPGALIESRSSGLPVVTTRHAGIPYIVKHGVTGLMANEYDEDALADHMLALAEDPDLRKTIGEAGQQFTLEQLDIRKKERDLEKIYSQLMARHHANSMQPG
jgi:colanic acid/amylovoran biosynthesis glycosyltransferase